RSMSGPPSTSSTLGGRTVARTVEINIESVTGQRWTEWMLLAESVYDLKERIWRRTKLPPAKQALIYSGVLLATDSSSLASVGVRAGATLKLVLLTRAGPEQPRGGGGQRRRAAVGPPPRMSAEEATSQSDREGPSGSAPSLRRCGRSSTRSSAPEDTSAKESSEGEEREEEGEGEEERRDGERRLSESLGSCSSRATARKQRTLSQCTVGGGGSTVAQSGEQRDDRREKERKEALLRAHSTSTAPSAAIPTVQQLQQMRQDENEEPENGGGDQPDDLSLSEMSSGVIICDLSNEFRKLKVKRRHHPSSGPVGGVNGGTGGGSKLPPLSARRARSKPRAIVAVSREATSSEDDADERADSSPNGAPAAAAWSCSAAAAAAASSRRAAQAVRQPRHMNGRQMLARCAVCALKLQSSIVCRCGKSLCARHRAGALHGCSKSAAAAASSASRSRPIAAQVSD
ncbi:hypothetical protein PENTCL1PPCAC_18396, partial [Pristionchus entomophagus]